MGFIKNVATAFKPSNVKRGLDAARNPPDQAAIDAAVAQLPPEQRAAYEANMAKVDEGRREAAAAWEQAREREEAVRVLGGPAGRHLYGPSMQESGTPAELERRLQQEGIGGLVKQGMRAGAADFRVALGQTFNRDVVAQEEDPERRREIAAAERAARDAARAPYLAPDRAPVQFSRLATRGATQVAELGAFLAASGLAARPDLVFGVYRVPDRISQTLTPHDESGRVVEWDVVHAPVDEVREVPVTATSFDARDQWIARRAGEPTVLDEDLGLAFLDAAGLAPERCLGIARVSEFRTLRRGDGEHEPLRTVVRGLVVLHTAVEGAGAFAALQAQAPLRIGSPPAQTHIEVLDWASVGAVVQPKIHHPPACPSPFPYLPATPQELLRAYLDVVGVQPQDCCSAQATVDDPSALQQGGLFTTNWGPKQPGADGKDRMRTAGGQQVVVVYRDREAYAEGRERWAAYGRDVLQADLRKGLRIRPPLRADEDLPRLPAPLAAIERVERALDWLDTLGDEELPPYRWCWPPVP